MAYLRESPSTASTTDFLNLHQMKTNAHRFLRNVCRVYTVYCRPCTRLTNVSIDMARAKARSELIVLQQPVFNLCDSFFLSSSSHGSHLLLLFLHSRSTWQSCAALVWFDLFYVDENGQRVVNRKSYRWLRSAFPANPYASVDRSHNRELSDSSEE